MATTQSGRLLSIATPLGEDFLLLKSMSATEEISGLFSIDVELLHEENEAGTNPTIVDPKKILGQAVTIGISQRDDTSRTFSGIVRHFTQGFRDTRFTYYQATIVPNVWVLTQSVQSRIFQRKTVPQILEVIFGGFEVSYEIQGSFEPRDYCVQYRESDFDFASRLMEEEGIYYYFEHTGQTDKLIIANNPQSHRPCPAKEMIPFIIDIGSDEDIVSRVKQFQMGYRLQTGTVTFWDYHFQLRTNKLESKQPSQFNIGGNQAMELYDFPGGYARKYDSNTGSVFSDKEKRAQIFMQSLDVRHQTAGGTSNFCGMMSGYKFQLINHPTDTLNAPYVITALDHQVTQSPDYITGEAVDDPYSNSFTCIGHGAGKPPFRPLQKTAKPKISGSQIAVVVGPPGEEIYTDKFGRVKVRFHWDREGKNDDDASCWMRVSQSWASNKWGAMFIPRVGMEVIVDFFEGDPDQPIITGCVYNPEAMPPYTLPDEKTKFTLKSNSSKGGGGFNELRFEDKKGEEQIFIHAEKDQDIRVKNDRKELVINDRHLIVKNNRFEKTEKDIHLKTVGDHNEKVDGTISVETGMDFLGKAATKFAFDAGSEIHLKSGTSMTLETGANLTLKVGGNFININSGGIFIKGTVVMINSGGAAGNGSGSSPNAPKAPLEAANADPGQDPPLPPALPPPEKTNRQSQAALVLVKAAVTGAAFCEICSRQVSPNITVYSKPDMREITEGEFNSETSRAALTRQSEVLKDEKQKLEEDRREFQENLDRQDLNSLSKEEIAEINEKQTEFGVRERELNAAELKIKEQLKKAESKKEAIADDTKESEGGGRPKYTDDGTL